MISTSITKMKRGGIILRLTLMMCLLGAFGVQSSAESVSLFKKLPNTEDFEISNSEGKSYHGDLGVMVDDQLEVFGIPLWNEGEPKYVLYHMLGTTHTSKFDFSNFLYVELSPEDIAAFQEIYPDIPTEPRLSFWERIGGKLVVILVIGALFAFYYIAENHKEKKRLQEAESDEDSNE